MNTQFDQDLPKIVQQQLLDVNGKYRLNISEEEKSLDLSDLTEIFSQLFKAIVERVDLFIHQQSEHNEQHDEHKVNKIVFSIGYSGSGSTSNVLGLTQIDQPELIGHERIVTKTILPNCFIRDNVIFVDFPGFNPTQGLTIWMAFETSLQFLFRHYHHKSILLINAPISAESCRFKLIDDLYAVVKRLFINHSQHSVLAFTMYDDYYNYFIQKYEPNNKEANSKRQDLIFEREQLFCQKLKVVNFLRFNDKQDKKLFQQNYEYLKVFPLMKYESFQPKSYSMATDIFYFFYPKYQELIQECHYDANLIIVGFNPIKLIPMILLQQKVPNSIIGFLIHPAGDKNFLIKLHNELIHQVESKINSQILDILPLFLQKSLKTLQSVKDEGEFNEKDIQDFDQFCQKSIKDISLPLWLKNSINFQDHLLIDIKILQKFVDSLKINESADSN